MKRVIHSLLFLSVLYFMASAVAEDVKVRHLGEGQKPTSAKLSDILWMQGHWKGKNPLTERFVEHILPNPQFNQLPGLVRFYKEDIQGNEISLFIERNGGLDYVVRHFYDGLIAVEPVDRPVVRSLIEIVDNHYYFDGITFVRDSPDQHTVYFEYTDGELKGQIVTVTLKRQ